MRTPWHAALALGAVLASLGFVLWVFGSLFGDEEVRIAAPVASPEQPADAPGSETDRADVEEAPPLDGAPPEDPGVPPDVSGESGEPSTAPPSSSASEQADEAEGEQQAAAVEGEGDVAPAESAPVTLGRIVGRITDGGTTAAEGLPGIEVRLYDSAGVFLRAAVTAAEPSAEVGTFAFEDVSDGEYSIIATRTAGTPRSILRDLDAFPPGADGILAVDIDFADPGAVVPTRTLTLPEGTIRLAGPVGADRDIIVEVIDAAGTNVGPAGGIAVPVDAGGVNAQVDLANIRVEPGLRLRVVGEGTPFRGYETATSEAFDLPPDLEPFVLPLTGPDNDAPRLDVTATTRVIGTIFGFSASPLEASPLEGATVTFPAQSRPDVSDESSFTVDTASDGSFAATVRAGSYLAGATSDRADAAFGGITVSASGYETRTLSGSIADSMSALPGVDEFFVLYTGLTGEPGDVGLDPSPRRVDVVVDLQGVTGSTTRDLVVRLVDGQVSVEGSSQALSDVSLSAASSATVTAGTAETFLSTSVRPATYELDIAVASGTRVILEDLVSDDAKSAVVRQGSGADVGKWFLDIQPGTTTVRLAATVQARTQIEVTVTGVQVDGDNEALLPESTPLAGAAVAAPPDAAAVSSPATTGGDGIATLIVNAGTYGAEDFSVSRDGYVEASFGGEFTDASETVSVTLEPAPTAFTGSILLVNAGGMAQERDVTVEVCTDRFCPSGTVLRTFQFKATAGTDAEFSSSDFELDELEVGVYWFTVSGPVVETTSVQRVIGPADRAYKTTLIEVDDNPV